MTATHWAGDKYSLFIRNLFQFDVVLNVRPWTVADFTSRWMRQALDGETVAESLSFLCQPFRLHGLGRATKHIQENIMLRRDGIAKVVDFGLAKLSETVDPGQLLDAEAATRVLLQTEPGVVMGTAAYFIAEVHATLGEKEQALTWLQKAYEERSGEVTFIKVNHRFDGLRSDPRFQDLLRRVGFPP